MLAGALLPSRSGNTWLLLYRSLLCILWGSLKWCFWWQHSLRCVEHIAPKSYFFKAISYPLGQRRKKQLLRIVIFCVFTEIFSHTIEICWVDDRNLQGKPTCSRRKAQVRYETYQNVPALKASNWRKAIRNFEIASARWFTCDVNAYPEPTSGGRTFESYLRDKFHKLCFQSTRKDLRDKFHQFRTPRPQESHLEYMVTMQFCCGGYVQHVSSVLVVE